jgi:hypothetical protein
MSLNDSRDAGEEIPEEVEIEAYGKRNVQPPKARRYVIRIDKTTYRVEAPGMTGRQLLRLADKTPVERYLISQKLHCDRPR